MAEIGESVATSMSTDESGDNWVDLIYLYADGTGVPDAEYEVMDSDGTVIATGTLDQHGSAHISIPVGVASVKVRFFNDPEEIEILPQPEKEPLKADEEDKNWLEASWDWLKGAANWVWGVLQGDFNEDPTAAQIITNLVITAIPVIDQVADVRDIIAALKKLVWEKRYDEIGPWVDLFFTLIGLIPTLGSVLKGVLKLVWKGAKLDAILRVFNYFAKGNGVKWLRKLEAGKLDDYAQQAARYGHRILDAIIRKMAEIKTHFVKLLDEVPGWIDYITGVKAQIVAVIAKIDDLLISLRRVKDRINRQFADIAEELKKRIGQMLGKKADDIQSGGAKSTVTKQQGASASGGKPKSKRLQYMGATPGKKSRTGREVIDRMDAEGKIIRDADGNATQFLASDGEWYDIKYADMSHKHGNSAVEYWNREGYKHGAKSQEVRDFMLNSDNYYLEHRSINRSEGAIMRNTHTYRPPGP